MKILKNSKSSQPYITVVCCQHGNEQFGLNVFDLLQDYIDSIPGLQIIVANEEAVAINKRCVEEDLNRSYPGDPNGSLESRLACKLMEAIQGSRYVLDIHTSVSSCGFLVPIIADKNEHALHVLNLLDTPNIIAVEKPLANKALIGNISGAVSLEFQKDLVGPERALNVMKDLVLGLSKNKKKKPQTRNMFTASGILPKELILPEGAKDYEYIPDLGIYPLILKDPSYMGNQGLKGTKKEVLEI